MSSKPLSYFRHHVFFCLNQRANGEASCGDHQAEAAFAHCKKQVHEAGLSGKGQVRVNKAGCLDRCAGGPVAVVYPEETWYTYVDLKDIEEIVESHLKHGKVVERLLLSPRWGDERARDEVPAMNAQTERLHMQGAAGRIEVLRDAPAPELLLRGVAVIAHPHPLFGGTMENKVVQTLARAFLQCGWRTVRFNFRGVGASEGAHDEGRGEADDFLAVVEQFAPASEGQPLALAGFSFGAFVMSHAMVGLAPTRPVEKLVFVGTAASRFQVAAVPPELHERTLVLHGEHDDTVPLPAVMDWARPQVLPVTVVPGGGHFFHGQLPLLKGLVVRHLSATHSGGSA